MASERAIICVVDDDHPHREALTTVLSLNGYQVEPFPSASELLKQNPGLTGYDILLSDINMPGLSGFDLCRAARSTPSAVRLPIILITGNEAANDYAMGLEAGADDFIGKPVPSRHLLAKIRSLLEIRNVELKKNEELKTSRGISEELGRFVSPNLVQRFGGSGGQNFLAPHRAEVTVLFTDLRGFTAFTERAEPEEVLQVLQRYYTAVGTLALKYKGTLGHLAGDGIMIFFNDPEPIENHREAALQMALEARAALTEQKATWADRGYKIDFGMGLSEGFATIGGIGFEQFSTYSVIGPVANFASRMCHLALGGQILISQRFRSRLKPEEFSTQDLGPMSVKGIEQPVSVFNVVSASLPKSEHKAS